MSETTTPLPPKLKKPIKITKPRWGKEKVEKFFIIKHEYEGRVLYRVQSWDKRYLTTSVCCGETYLDFRKEEYKAIIFTTEEEAIDTLKKARDFGFANSFTINFNYAHPTI